MSRPWPLLFGALLGLWACDRGSTAQPSPRASASLSAATQAASPPGPASSSGASPPSASPPASAPPPASAWPGRTDGCPEGMVRVEGDYCPAVVQECLEHHVEYKNSKAKNVSERCLRYAEPTKCVSKERVKMSFCIDRFEYPNKPGELPRVLTQWTEAVKRCENEGKRLCTEDEFNFACEGPEMRPYVNGFTRDQTVCNIDRPYHRPDHSRRMKTYDRCLADPACSAEMKRLDQRHPIGERLTCVSWAGVFDMNGNVNEWVNLPKEERPNRSGLKGGWWGPVRNRCRPTVTFHKEEDYGYEQGFRCCKDATR